MKVNLEPGTYVVAVSGGVDSMTLLHLLFTEHKQAKAAAPLNLIVAHLDHGIRPDSALDRKLVQARAAQYGLPFVYTEAQLGPAASEATARQARYAFLHRTMQENKAQAIITAHHQDDLIETAIINLARGTGRKGPTALQEHSDIRRPLLGLSKSQLLAYAKAHDLAWREDSTNQDTTYLRNYIRHNIMPRLNGEVRDGFCVLLADLRGINQAIDQLLDETLLSQSESGQLDRRWFIQLPHEVAREVMAAWLRAHHERQFDSRMLERLVIAAKVSRPGRRFSISKRHALYVEQGHLALRGPER